MRKEGAMGGKWLTTEGAAAQLCLTAQTVRELVRTGKLKAYKPGKRLLIDPDDLELYVKSSAREKSKGREDRAKTA